MLYLDKELGDQANRERNLKQRQQLDRQYALRDPEKGKTASEALKAQTERRLAERSAGGSVSGALAGANSLIGLGNPKNTQASRSAGGLAAGVRRQSPTGISSGAVSGANSLIGPGIPKNTSASRPATGPATGAVTGALIGPSVPKTQDAIRKSGAPGAQLLSQRAAPTLSIPKTPTKAAAPNYASYLSIEDNPTTDRWWENGQQFQLPETFAQTVDYQTILEQGLKNPRGTVTGDVISGINRGGYALSSIGKSTAATLPVMADSMVQSVKDAVANRQSQEWRAAEQKVLEARRELELARQMNPDVYNEESEMWELNPLNANVQQRLEDAQAALEAVSQSTPVSMDQASMKLMTSAYEDREKALEGLEGTSRFVGDTLISVADNAVALPAAFVNPAAPLAIMGAKASAGKIYELSQQGVGAAQALERGLVSGGIEILTEKIPLDNVLDALGGKKTGGILLNTLKQMATEAGEEGASYALNYVADRAYHDPNAQFTLEELFYSMAGGGLSGGIMGGISNTVGAYRSGTKSDLNFRTDYTAQEASEIRKESKTFRNVVAGWDISAKEFFNKWKNGRGQEKFEKLYLGKTTPQAAQKIGEILGYPVESRDYIIANDDVVHIMKNHGDPVKESNRGQIAVTADIFDQLPAILQEPDRIYKGDLDGYGKEGVIFERLLSDGTAVYIQFDNAGRRTLQGKTLYIKKKNSTSMETSAKAAESQTPKATEPEFFGSMIPQGQSEVNSSTSSKNLLSEIFGVTEKKNFETPITTETTQTGGYSNGVQSSSINSTIPQGQSEVNSSISTAGGVDAENALTPPPTTPTMELEVHNMGGAADGRAGEEGTQLQYHSRGLQADAKGRVRGIEGSYQYFPKEKNDGQNRYRYESVNPDAITSPELKNKISTAQGLASEFGINLDFVSGKVEIDGKAYGLEGISFGENNVLLNINSSYTYPFLVGHESLHTSSRGGSVFAQELKMTFAQAYQEGNPMVVRAVERARTANKEQYNHPITDAHAIEEVAADYCGQMMEEADTLMKIRSLYYQSEYLDTVDYSQLDMEDLFYATMAELHERAPKDGAPPPQGPYGPNTVGAAQRGDSPTYERLVADYGAIPEGENLARTVDVPVSTDGSDRVRQFTRTLMEAQATPDGLLQEFEQAVMDGSLSYEVQGDKGALRQAQYTIQTHGFDGALRIWEGIVNGTRPADKNGMALGQTLYAEAAKAGDSRLAMRLAAELAAEGTRAGQTVQAMRLLKKMTPEGNLYYINKAVEHLQNDLIQKFKDKAPNLTLDETLVQELLDAKTREEIDIANDKIYQSIADQTPKTWMDKWNAWRYFSMLGNPRTMIRNFVGNAIFVPVRKFKNVIGMGLEKTFLPKYGPGSEFTKAILTKEDAGLKEFARQDFIEMQDVITGSGKLSPSSIIRDKQQIFDTKWLENARKGVTNVLETTDAWFLKGAYVDSLAQYMKANDLDPVAVKPAQLEKARTYAIREAQKATYRDANALASWLNRSKRQLAGSDNPGMRFGGVLLEGAVPFTKTPLNIVKRGVEYSPAGLAKSLSYDLYQLRQGSLTANQVIDNAASGLTGTMIMGLGMWLRSIGLVSGGGDEEKKKENFDALTGGQNYAIQIGDYSYTIDWTAPASLPLFVGVELYDALTDENPGKNLTDFLDNMTKISDPMFNLTMLSGLNNLVKSAGYGNGAGTILADTVAGYLGQGVPTILGQTARTLDGTRRSTYYKDKNSWLPAAAQPFLLRNAAKIPVLSTTLEPYVDQWGREEREPNLAVRAFENFLSPGYLSRDNTTHVDQELKRIYEDSGESAVLPSYAPKSYTLGGRTYNLTQKEYTQVSKVRGQTAYELLDDLIGRREYGRLSEAQKAEVIQKIYRYSSELAKEKFLDGRGVDYASDEMKKAKEAIGKGIPADLYFIAWAAQKDVEGDRDRNGETVYLSSSKNKKEQIDRATPGLSLRQRKTLYEAFGVSEKVW